MINNVIKACADYLVVEPVYEEKMGLIYLPDGSKKQESNFYGIVISVGPEFPFKEIKAGDKVLYRRNEGTEIESGGKKYIALSPKWVTAEVEDDNRT